MTVAANPPHATGKAPTGEEPQQQEAEDMADNAGAAWRVQERTGEQAKRSQEAGDRHGKGNAKKTMSACGRSAVMNIGRS